MDINEFIEELRDTLVESDLESGVAGVAHEPGDLGLKVSMQDGSEFYLSVTATD